MPWLSIVFMTGLLAGGALGLLGAWLALDIKPEGAGEVGVPEGRPLAETCRQARPGEPFSGGGCR